MSCKITQNVNRKEKQLVFYTVPGIHFWVKITGFSGKTTMLGRENDSSLMPLLHLSLAVFLCLVTRAGTLCTSHWKYVHWSCAQHVHLYVPRTGSWRQFKESGFMFFESRQWTENKQAEKGWNFALNFPVTLGCTEECAKHQNPYPKRVTGMKSYGIYCGTHWCVWPNSVLN